MGEEKTAFWKGISIKAILLGVLCGEVVTLLLILLFSVLLLSLQVPAAVVDLMALVAVGAGGLTAGFLCGKVLREKGMLVGGICGAVMLLLLLVFGACCGEPASGLMTVWKLLILLSCSLLGGVLGVNAKGRTPKLSAMRRHC